MKRGWNLISPKGDEKNLNRLVIIIGPSDLKYKVIFNSSKPLRKKEIKAEIIHNIMDSRRGF